MRYMKRFLVMAGLIPAVSLVILLVAKELSAKAPSQEVISHPAATLPAGERKDAQAGITQDEDSRLLPGPPGLTKHTRSGQKDVLTWQGTRLDILSSYRIYRACQGRARHLAREIPVRGDNSGSYEAVIDSPSSECRYTISAVDNRGNEGPEQTVD
jgi:hypothetical protein